MEDRGTAVSWTAATLEITPDMLRAVELAVAADRTYSAATGCGRKFGITGEVGEVLVCHALGLRMVRDPRSAGFDGVDAKGNRVQIKTRRAEVDELPKDTGRLSTFSGHDFDYALMGILNRNYTLVEVWRADAASLLPFIAKHKRSNPTLREFKKAGIRLQ